MKTRYVVVLSDEDRRALAKHQGEKGLATRKQVHLWVDALVRSTLDTIVSEFNDEMETRKP